ncbi:MAG: response regulator [Bacteroidota bacterium]
MQQPIRILLADDHPIVVEGVQEILKTIPHTVVVGIAHDGLQLLELVRSQPADLVILDVNMPHHDGLECAYILKLEFPQLKMLFLTMYHDRSLVNQMIEAGAHGCILKSKGSRELREAIARIMEGKSFFDFIPDPAESDQDKVKLSSREIEIIRLLVKGTTNGQIAEQLFISEHTVKTHRKNILRKLNIHNISQLSQYARSRGWE